MRVWVLLASASGACSRAPLVRDAAAPPRVSAVHALHRNDRLSMAAWRSGGAVVAISQPESALACLDDDGTMRPFATCRAAREAKGVFRIE